MIKILAESSYNWQKEFNIWITTHSDDGSIKMSENFYIVTISSLENIIKHLKEVLNSSNTEKTIKTKWNTDSIIKISKSMIFIICGNFTIYIHNVQGFYDFFSDIYNKEKDTLLLKIKYSCDL